MKNAVLLLLVIGGLFSTSCQKTKKTDNPEMLKTIIVQYFEAIKMKDFQKMKDLSTNDFILFENGKVFNNDSLINILISRPNTKADYSFGDFIINIDNTTGNARYSNHGKFTTNDTVHREVNWLESATFKKVDDTWKIEFLHSTVRK